MQKSIPTPLTGERMLFLRFKDPAAFSFLWSLLL